MGAIHARDKSMIGLTLAIAESQSLEELGATCHTAARHLIDMPTIGLYLKLERSPGLIVSHNAPQGFLNEYISDLAPCDPLFEAIKETRHAVPGSRLRQSKREGVRVMNDLLQRWGFSENMCGPLFVGAQIAGFIYVADQRMCEAGPTRTERMDYICRAASLALDHIAAAREMGSATMQTLVCLPGSGKSLPPRLAEVAALVCKGLTNKQIARTLNISHHTVKEHVASLCIRFGVSNRTGLATAFRPRVN